MATPWDLGISGRSRNLRKLLRALSLKRSLGGWGKAMGSPRTSRGAVEAIPSPMLTYLATAWRSINLRVGPVGHGGTLTT